MLYIWMEDSQEQLLFETLASELRCGCYNEKSKVNWLDTESSSSDTYQKEISTTIKKYQKTLGEVSKKHKVDYSFGDEPSTQRAIFLTVLLSKKKIGIFTNPLVALFLFSLPFVPAFGRLIYEQTFHGDEWY